ncbi:MAG TPA: EamA family transporter [Gaiellaceae bacterium]|nr:EamA family transporter [Gaiellaceae bacterium]
MAARPRFLLALWTVYVVWGSTYFAIKISVRTLPPLVSAGTRFLLAGALLALFLAWRGKSLRATPRELGAAALLGVALLGVGVGGTTLAETRIDSSVAAMIAGTVPLQVILWRALSRERVALATRVSVVVGLVGLALVVLPGGEGAASLVGLATMLGATVSWSAASFFGRRLPTPGDPFVATAWEMTAAGAALTVAGFVAGEGGDLSVAMLEPGPVLAWLYLGIFGSLVAFSAYVWLLANAPISKVVTHQYVNPLVAIALGALFLDEALPLTTLAGAAVIVGSVYVAVRAESAPRSAAVQLSPLVGEELEQVGPREDRGRPAA